MLRFDVPRMDRQITVVTKSVYTTTVTHAGSAGNTCSRYSRMMSALTIGSSR